MCSVDGSFTDLIFLINSVLLGGAVDGQRAPLPSQGSIYSAARSTASALEAAARATNPSIASR